MSGKARIASIFLFAMLSMALASCLRMGESAIKLPVNPILTGGLGWGVVKDAYVRLKEKPSESARDMDHLRRGGVFELNSRVMEDQHRSSSDSGSGSGEAPMLWYGITSEGFNGWVRGSELDIYASQVQAERAASAYR